MADQPDKIIITIPKESNELLKEINALRRELLEYKKKWEEAQLELSENNIALEALAKNEKKIRSRTKLRLKKKLASEVLPHLEEIKSEKNSEKIRTIVELILTKIRMISSTPADHYSILVMLTPMEIRIASMIKDGYKSKDIASLQHISLETVKTHRRSIRKKFGLKHRQVDLASFLKSRFT